MSLGFRQLHYRHEKCFQLLMCATLGLAAQAHSRATGLRTARVGGQSHGQQQHQQVWCLLQSGHLGRWEGCNWFDQGREASMGTPALSRDKPALSREKSDLARRSVAMITKEAVGSPKVPNQLQTFENFSDGQICSLKVLGRAVSVDSTSPGPYSPIPEGCVACVFPGVFSPMHSHLYRDLLPLFNVVIIFT